MHGRPSEDIMAVAEEPEIQGDGKSVRRKQKFGGRRSVWPGAIALIVGIAGAIAALSYWGVTEHTAMLGRQPNNADLAKIYGSGTTISDGKSATDNSSALPITVTNPKEYEDKLCKQINFFTEDNKIMMQAGGEATQLSFKGVNWRGFEGWDHLITGLWDGPRDGNTLYQIATFLKKNGFNAVRFPLDIDSAARNIPVKNNFNTNSQRALGQVNKYIDALTLITEGLGQHNIAVVFDFNTRSKADLNSTTQTVIPWDTRVSDQGDLGNGWNNVNVQFAQYKAAVENIATAMCNGKHYNVVGIDVKDVPQGASGQWDGDEKTNWSAFATKVGNAIITACPQWLVFVQGLNGKSAFGEGTSAKTVEDWQGATLTEAVKSPITLSKPNKVVYSPPFWSPHLYPKAYFYKSSTGGSTLSKYEEFTDKTALQASMDDAIKKMFGELLTKTSAPVVLSYFGGLYGEDDKHPKKTGSNAIDCLVNRMTTGTKTISGGFWWALNPDQSWPHPAPDDDTPAQAGLLDKTWRTAVDTQLDAVAGMNKMPGHVFLPCDPR